MNLNAYEKIFACLMITLALIGVVLFNYFHYSGTVAEIDLTTPEPPDTEYPVDILNSASKEDFMCVNGIGQVRAEDIIAFREAIGGFKRVEQIKEVSGIGESAYHNILDYFYGSVATISDKTPGTSTATEETFVPAEISTTTEILALHETSAPVETYEPIETSAVPAKTSPPETSSKTESFSQTNPNAKSESETFHSMRPVNINTASAEEISDALCLTSEQAEAIVELREKIDRFSTVEELYLLDFMDSTLYQEIKEYVIFD